MSSSAVAGPAARSPRRASTPGWWRHGCPSSCPARRTAAAGGRRRPPGTPGRPGTWARSANGAGRRALRTTVGSGGVAVARRQQLGAPARVGSRASSSSSWPSLNSKRRCRYGSGTIRTGCSGSQYTAEYGASSSSSATSTTSQRTARWSRSARSRPGPRTVLRPPSAPTRYWAGSRTAVGRAASTSAVTPSRVLREAGQLVAERTARRSKRSAPRRSVASKSGWRKRLRRGQPNGLGARLHVREAAAPRRVVADGRVLQDVRPGARRPGRPPGRSAATRRRCRRHAGYSRTSVLRVDDERPDAVDAEQVGHGDAARAGTDDGDIGRHLVSFTGRVRHVYPPRHSDCCQLSNARATTMR